LRAAADPSPAEQRRIWDAKPTLRAVYQEYFDEISAARVPGRTVEVGAGSGVLADSLPGVWSTDVVPSPFVDVVADAQALPFAPGSVANIVGLDVLHHVEFPDRFFEEAASVLSDGGRIVLVEPGITPVSHLFFRLFHPEPVDLDADPLETGERDPARRPFDANQAVPTLLAGPYRDRFHRRHPTLRLTTARRLGLLAYPLSGGYRRWTLVPARLAPRLLRIERRLTPTLGRFMAFRLLLVIEHRCAR
jgi:SAM-dependent methyltransferase